MTELAQPLFSHVPPYGGDPILSLMETFQADTRADKVSLDIGVYFDNEGRLPVLPSVRRAESMLAQQGGPRTYLPMEGLSGYRSTVQELLLGAEHEPVTRGRVATVQTLGGFGALRIGADFLRRYYPDSGVWVSDPTWEDHHAIFLGVGLKVTTHPCCDPVSGGLRFEAMLAQLGALPRHSVVLLHACCHNPTGVDLSAEQWLALIPVLRERALIPFVDIACQGFGDGLAEDAFALRALADAGIGFLVANSFSKNFSLYGERCGGLSEAQVDRLRDEHAVYLVRSGRLCISGLTTHNMDHVAQAMAAVLEQT